MKQLCVYGAPADSVAHLREQLAAVLDLKFYKLDDVHGHEPGMYTLVDTSLHDISHLLELKHWLTKKPKGAKVIFAANRASRLDDARAFGVGATDVVHRPLSRRDILDVVGRDPAPPANPTAAPQEAVPPVPGPESVPKEFAPANAPGAVAASRSLQDVFTTVTDGGKLAVDSVHAASTAIVNELEAQGLASWVDTVRTHHSQTYQHCLLVTGIAVAFGLHLGFPQGERQRLSFAGMLHDVGKARIPVSILEKPGPLNKDERELMQLHPELGADVLRSVPGVSPEMRDMVLHHHEYLDGSGYPHRLSNGQISDLVRVMTICDIFGALLERRSYKPPMSGDAAYQVLIDMGPKLDTALVRAFKPIAQTARL